MYDSDSGPPKDTNHGARMDSNYRTMAAGNPEIPQGYANQMPRQQGEHTVYGQPRSAQYNRQFDIRSSSIRSSIHSSIHSEATNPQLNEHISAFQAKK